MCIGEHYETTLPEDWKLVLDVIAVEPRITCRYALYDPQGTLLFSGEEFKPSPLHAWHSNENIGSLLAFLTLQPGDTDDEYFDEYTEEQRIFCTSYQCEMLGNLWREHFCTE